MQVYMSYAPEDREFADYLAIRLKNAGVPIWIDTQNAPQDDEQAWHEACIAAYDASQVIVIVLTPEACRHEQVRTEWHHAVELRRPIVGALAIHCIPDLPMKKYADFTRQFEPAFHRFMHLLFEAAQRRPGFG